MYPAEGNGLVAAHEEAVASGNRCVDRFPVKIIVGVNLSPAWVPVLLRAGHEAVHWSTIGAPNAADREILAWARDHGHLLLTHDLDFGAILAATRTNAPSVVQIRAQDVTPDHAHDLLLDVLRRFADPLSRGALVSVDETSARVRMLPLSRS